MFLNRDISRLSKLVDSNVNIYEHLTETEIDAIGSYIKNIRETIFIPKHKRTFQTIILKKIFHDQFILSNYIRNISKSITGSYEIRIALSFLVSKNMNHTNMDYIFAIHHRIINNNNRVIRDQHDADQLINNFKNKSQSDLLFTAFETFLKSPSIQDKPGSGWAPKRLVLAVVWLSKNNGQF